VAARDEATLDHMSSEPARPEPSEPGRVRYFGDYEIVRELARGGMGVVSLARQISLNRPVALKMILAGQLADEIDVRRFYTEAEAAANLDHPGIVPIYEVGRHDGQHYFSMGFVEGQSLAQRLADGPLPPREAAAQMIQVAEAIEYAHSRGVIHRDLKPGNILLDRKGRPQVTDFGLAKKLQSDSGLTGSGQIMGTPSYMPPEQAGGHRGAVGPTADVYALGATLYALLTGRPPFQAATAMETVLQVLGDEPVPLRRLNPSISRDLETIVLTCLAKEPGRRYASAAGLADDLGRFLEGEPILARPVNRFERAIKWARRRPMIAALAGTTLLATVIGVVGIAWQWRKAEAQRGIAVEKTREATEKAESLERQLYVNRVNLALREAAMGNLPRANGLLEAGPPRLRRWEWDYVRRLCHLDRLTFSGHGAPLWAVAFSPDGRTVASGSGDWPYSNQAGHGELVLWDSSDGRERFARRGLRGAVQCLAFSPDGRRLATGSGLRAPGLEGMITVRDASDGRVLLERPVPGLSVLSVAYSPDGRRFLAGLGYFNSTEVGHAELLDAVDLKEVRRFPGGPGGVTVAAFAPGGDEVALASAGQVDLWGLTGRSPARMLRAHQKWVYALAFSPDGARIATGGFDGLAVLWDRRTGEMVRKLEGHASFVRALAFSPDGGRLLTGGEDNSTRIWDVGDGRLVAAFRGHSGFVQAVAYSPQGHTLATAGLDRMVKLWDARAGAQVMYRGHDSWVRGASFAPSGRLIATTKGGNYGTPTLDLWDPETGRRTRRVDGVTGFYAGVSFSPDGRRLAVAGADGVVRLLDPDTGAELAALRGHRGQLRCLAFEPAGRWIATSCDDGLVRMFDPGTGECLRSLDGHGGPVCGLAISRDGRVIASAEARGLILVRDVEDGRVRWRLDRPGATIDPRRDSSPLALSPDGSRLASIGWDDATRSGEVRAWELQAGRLAFAARGHSGIIHALVFSPEGERIFSASDDKTIRIWDARTGDEVLRLEGHTAAVLCLDLSPDGGRLISGGLDQTARIWDARPLPADRGQP
jgi:WD40 repeat protein